MRESSDSARGQLRPADHALSPAAEPPIRHVHSPAQRLWGQEWAAAHEFPFDAGTVAEFEQHALALLTTIDLAFDELDRTERH